MSNSYLTVNKLKMVSQVLQQYRDISLNSNKFFFYAYGKLDVKLQAINRDSRGDFLAGGEIDPRVELKVRISYPELKELLGKNEIRKRDVEKILDSITENGYLRFWNEEEQSDIIIFIYNTISINWKVEYIEVFFNDNVVRLFEAIRYSQYSKIDFYDVIQLSSKYQMNLYLFALTVLRGARGIVTRKLEDLRDILGKESTIKDDVFVHRFITSPAKDITANENISIAISTKRDGDNIQIAVSKTKEAK